MTKTKNSPDIGLIIKAVIYNDRAEFTAVNRDHKTAKFTLLFTDPSPAKTKKVLTGTNI